MSPSDNEASGGFKARMRTWFEQVRLDATWQQLQRRCPPAALAAKQIPLHAQRAWQGRAGDELPGLLADDLAWVRCATALAQFFEACRLQSSQGPCALPSRAADSVWHVWLAIDEAGLARWQQQFFGQTLAHQAHADGGSDQEPALARTWIGACRSEGRSPIAGAPPLVFALDAVLRLPTGWAYQRRGERVVHRRIDAFGQPGAQTLDHPSLSPAGLLGLGLLSADEEASLRRRHGDGGGSGSATDGGFGSDVTVTDCGGDPGSSGSSCSGGGD